MKTLFIDTHLFDIVIMLLEDGKLVDKCEVINQKNNSEYLFPSIIKVIDNQKIDEIIVVNGPGSFTSIRLGVTVAKTLAYTLNIPIKTISSLCVSALSNNSRFTAISDNNGYYLAEFDTNFNKVNYSYVSNNEFKNNNKYVTDYKIDIKKVYEYLKDQEYENVHLVKPIYIKKIGVELDKKSQ